MKPVIALAICAGLLAGCATDLRDVGKRPALSPVGSGIGNHASRIPVGLKEEHHFPRNGSFWSDRGADLFRDPRARHAGDIVTVEVSVKDRASLDNSSDRSRASTRDLNLGIDYDVGVSSISTTGSGTTSVTTDSDSIYKGKGTTSRSEDIELELAVVVTRVLPNGNLVISGSQEVRVNFEVRVLNIAGVIRPRDISPDNRISYDKIAEARVSYGGRGRIMEVQQPSLGQQVLDHVVPF
ncbi:MAG: flagellar basal body L-ring protein FlgH [Hyphomicrobiaceae bacterium]